MRTVFFINAIFCGKKSAWTQCFSYQTHKKKKEVTKPAVALKLELSNGIHKHRISALKEMYSVKGVVNPNLYLLHVQVHLCLYFLTYNLYAFLATVVLHRELKCQKTL